MFSGLLMSFASPLMFHMPIFKNEPLKGKQSSGFNLFLHCEQSHLAISVTEMHSGGLAWWPSGQDSKHGSQAQSPCGTPGPASGS